MALVILAAVVGGRAERRLEEVEGDTERTRPSSMDVDRPRGTLAGEGAAPRRAGEIRSLTGCAELVPIAGRKIFDSGHLFELPANGRSVRSDYALARGQETEAERKVKLE